MRKIYYRELPSKRRFGVELELSNTVSKTEIADSLRKYEDLRAAPRDIVVTRGTRGWAETLSNNYWHVKYDSTCGPKGHGRDSGWEVASYIGKGYSDIRGVSKVADWFQSHGLKTNKNCGLHIHIEAKDLSVEQMGILMARWVKIEEFLFQICEPHRSKSKYCRSFRWRWQNISSSWRRYKYNSCKADEFYALMSPKSFGTHGNSEKKHSLNVLGYTIGRISPSHKRQTVELRMPECILNSSHVQHWLQLMLFFVESCKMETIGPDNVDSVTSVAEFLYLLGLHQHENAFIVLDKQLLSTKIWLLQKIVNSPQISKIHADEALDLLAFISKF